MTILGVSGSIRTGSSNTALLLAAQGLAIPFTTVEIYPSIGELPHFNPDLDREGIELPSPVAHFRRAIASSDALLISTPEYAHGIPGVLKNALDWLVSYPEFAGKPVGILLASASDGHFAQSALIEVLNTMSARVIPAAIATVAGSRIKTGSNGNLTDEQTKKDLLTVLRALSERKL